MQSKSFIEMLKESWQKNDSLLCLGLDTELTQLPKHLLSTERPVYEFNCRIIESTADLVCAYKPNIAFYAGRGLEQDLQLTIEYIHEAFPHIPVILDSKRGDIGNTAELYAVEAFDRFKADAVTVTPYLGSDSLEPFLRRTGRGVIVVCRSSNPGASEFQSLICDGKPLYLHVAERAARDWNKGANICLVVGATAPREIQTIRQTVGDDVPFLVPGIGAQGGDVELAVKAGINSRSNGLIINSSRAIIFASKETDYAQAARNKAIELKNQINSFRV